MKSTFDTFIEAACPTIVERITLPAKEARYGETPEAFRKGDNGKWLKQMLRGSQLWRHQALALDHLANGANLVISTSTASGKTFVFQAAVMRALMEGNGRSIILYTQKALSGDQLHRWKSSLEAASLSPDLVGEINGDVSMAEREAVLESCPIILMTEDVLHAYVMRNLASPAVQGLLKSLRCIVIDEAHALEGVFGSSCAFLFRRLLSAVLSIRAANEIQAFPLQFIAATATIADPIGHLQRLTGCHFESITDVDNGAPFHGMDLMHIEGPKHGASCEKMVADIIENLASTIAPNAAIAFVDSRQAAERITQRVNLDEVQPYRSGYHRADRRDIETRMREGKLRGVVATSALELGIDVPGFTIGMTADVPQSRKSLRQRVGRAGRAQPSVFAVIAPSTAFAQLGTTFGDYVHGAVEQSPLYLDNQFIQFQHALCLAEEVRTADGKASLPDNVDWPNGFAKMFEAAQPGSLRPRELDQISMNCNGSPHLSFSLRHIASAEYRLRGVRGADDAIGTIDLEKALREAFPGAKYIHRKAVYRVVGWTSNPYENSILLKRVPHGPDTRPMLTTRVSVSHHSDAIIDQRLRHGTRGSIAEMNMRVVEAVEGYTIGKNVFPYAKLQETDRSMRRKMREFSTTGILIRINDDWFNGDSDAPRASRRAVGEALVTMLARERCISPSELRFAHTQIKLHSAAGSSRIEDAIAIFDSVQGGLRLTAPLFEDVAHLLDLLSKAVDLAGVDAMLGRSTVDRLVEWESELEQSGADDMPSLMIEGGERIIFAPESEVAVRVRGELYQRRLIEPQLMWIGDEEQLGYRYEASPGVSAWIPHDKVETGGGDWRNVIWNARSGELREIAA